MKTRLKLWVKLTILLILIICLLLFYAFYINNQGFKVKEIALYENIPEEYNGLKVVHFSDLNYGKKIHKKEFNKIIKKINLIEPDIVVFTGDLIYKENKDDLENLKILLTKIDYNIGKYYVSGDQDDDITKEILNGSGFINLDNNYNLIYLSSTPILISGITGEGNIDSTLDYLNNNDIFAILLTHKPNNLDKIDYSKFNLVLAGHTLGGYINIPYVGGLILTSDHYNYGKNYYKKDNTHIYISNGLGNEEYDFRILNKPSFNFYRIRKNND